MTLTKYTLILSVLATLLSSAACSSDDEKGSTGFDSGLPTDKQLGELTADEIAQLNKAEQAYTKQQSSSLTKEQACLSEAVTAGLGSIATDPLAGKIPTDASVQQICTDKYTTCIASTDTHELPGRTVTEAQLKDCKATVGEGETCNTEMTAASLSYFKSLPACSTLTIAGAAKVGGGYTTPASCTALFAKCPSLAGDTP